KWDCEDILQIDSASGLARAPRQLRACPGRENGVTRLPKQTELALFRNTIVPLQHTQSLTPRHAKASAFQPRAALREHNTLHEPRTPQRNGSLASEQNRYDDAWCQARK